MSQQCGISLLPLAFELGCLLKKIWALNTTTKLEPAS